MSGKPANHEISDGFATFLHDIYGDGPHAAGFSVDDMRRSHGSGWATALVETSAALAEKERELADLRIECQVLRDGRDGPREILNTVALMLCEHFGDRINCEHYEIPALVQCLIGQIKEEDADHAKTAGALDATKKALAEREAECERLQTSLQARYEQINHFIAEGATLRAQLAEEKEMRGAALDAMDVRAELAEVKTQLAEAQKRADAGEAVVEAVRELQASREEFLRIGGTAAGVRTMQRVNAAVRALDVIKLPEKRTPG